VVDSSGSSQSDCGDAIAGCAVAIETQQKQSQLELTTIKRRLKQTRTKSLRVAGERPTGGQEGHPGRTLSQASEPDKIVFHNVPDQCQAYQRELPFAYVNETRQVFDLPVTYFKYRFLRRPQPQ
jgi:hypothetical protein